MTLPEVLNRLVITPEIAQFITPELEEWFKNKNNKHKKIVKHSLKLQEILKNKGFSLNLLLCEGMIKTLEEVFRRDLTIEDIKFAADSYIKLKKKQ